MKLKLFSKNLLFVKSGSGKTTLLNVLNYKSGSNLTVEGEILINGVVTNPRKMALVSCYVQQDDFFFGTMTVKEHLEFQVRIF